MSKIDIIVKIKEDLKVLIFLFFNFKILYTSLTGSTLEIFTMSMDLQNVKSDTEQVTKVNWTHVTAKGKTAVKKIQSALLNQTDEDTFKKEITESLQPVFKEVYLLVKTNVPGYEEFLEQFPALHDMKNPNWKNMFQEATFNAANVPNADLKKQLTDMEIRLKAIDHNMPNTRDFIKVTLYDKYQNMHVLFINTNA